MIRKVLLIFVAVTMVAPVHAQASGDDKCTRQTHPFAYGQLFIPALLIGAGALRIEPLDKLTRDEMQRHVTKPFHIDDYTQFSPMMAVYALNACGVKGRHNFRDRTLILASAYLMMGVSVHTVKYATGVARPGSGARNSFPSGHTAHAFMGAEFLRQEYRDQSSMIGFAGYVAASFTGVMRIYNNAHWLSDVIAGAGFGILSAQIAYWTYPSLQNALFKNTRLPAAVAMPFYNGKNAGLSMFVVF